MKVQGSDFKSVSELGGDPTKLTKDSQIYLTGSSINKTFKQAIESGDISSGIGKASVIVATGTTYDMSTTASGSVIEHTQAATCTYALPAATSTLKTFTFHHRGIKTGFTNFSNTMRVQPAAGDQIRFKNNCCVNPGYIQLGRPGVSITIENVDATTWVVTKVSYAPSEKNSTIGTLPDVAILSKNTAISRTPMPVARFDMAGFSIHGYGYISTGAATGTAYGNDSVQYNDTTNAWCYFLPHPLALRAAGSWPLNGMGYVYGGTTTGAAQTAVYRYDEFTYNWGSRTSTNYYSTWMAGFAFNGYGYSSGLHSAAVQERFNDATNAWTTGPTHIAGDERTVAFVLNGYGYLAGRNTSGNETSQYNDSYNGFITRAPSYTAQEPCGEALNGYGLYCGQPSGNVIRAYNDMLDSWAVVGYDAQNRAQQRAFVLDGFCYLCGGLVNYPNNTLDVVTQYN